MTYRCRRALLVLSAVLALAGCGTDQPPKIAVAAGNGTLAGAWRSKIIFRSGPLAGLKDLEFLYAYNAGGTMTESSNYDEAANASPPAYGIWRQTEAGTFQSKYVFYTTREPGLGDGAPGGRDWWPAGHGVLSETITLSDDGQSYVSTVILTTYDKAGAAIADGGGEGTGAATRITF